MTLFRQHNARAGLDLPERPAKATSIFDTYANAWSNPKHGGGSAAGQFIGWHTIED
ncbi:MAG: hypothetical protein WDN31_18365 [Hyphomicrobium sp.]